MTPAAQTLSSRFLTFRVDEQLYALPCEDVTEVIRIPPLARLPQGPAALLGIANLRGAVLPVAGSRVLLGRKPAPQSTAARALVLDVGAPVALVVDSVVNLEIVNSETIETRQKELSAAGDEKLLGLFVAGAQKEAARILDIRGLLEAAFAARARGPRQERKAAVNVRLESEGRRAARTNTLVTFDVAGQEFALPLSLVQEILPAPADITAVARVEAVVLGITSLRDTLLPLLSLRGLLGFARGQGNEREKVVVVNLGGTRVGLVVDSARAIVAADVDRIEPIPPALAARAGGESRIESIYRATGARGLISILSPQQLFREEVMQRLAAGTRAQSTGALESGADTREELIFLVFRLGDAEFGLPIDSVVEVARVPAQITRVPRTPKFLEGVVNLRGDILPVVDQRRRFDMPQLDDTEGRRLIVVKTERHRAGLIVDSVSDVLRTDAGNVDPPPELTEQTSRLVRGVINLPKSGRIVLLLDPTELLTRAEQGLLDTFQAQSRKADA